MLLKNGIYNVKRYCSDDISLIENYERAISDNEQWVCHHRKETDDGLTSKQLIKLGLYYNRPASELIFLTRSEHQRLHNMNAPEITHKKWSECQRGRKFSDEHKQKLSESQTKRFQKQEERDKISIKNKGKKKKFAHRKCGKKRKHLWMTPDYELIIMSPHSVGMWHPDWIWIEKI